MQTGKLKYFINNYLLAIHPELLNTQTNKTTNQHPYNKLPAKMSKKTVSLKTHRYEFSEPAMMELQYFTQVHKYDERKAFKEAWKKWVQTEDIAKMIATETARLTSEGFVGDIEAKMFTAVRYYFRKKPAQTENPVEQTPRKKYVGFTGNILTSMDRHILGCIKSNMQPAAATPQDDPAPETPKKPCAVFTSNISPDKSFLEFYNTSSDIIANETELLKESSDMDDDAIYLKIKKTYKNRYQTIRKKLDC